MKAIGWAGVTSKFVKYKPQRFGALLWCDQQAALPWADYTPKEMREQLGLAELFVKSSLCNYVDVCYSFLFHIHYKAYYHIAK